MAACIAAGARAINNDSSLVRTKPDDAEKLLSLAPTAVTEKYRQYEELASRDGSRFRASAPAEAEVIA